MRPGPVTVAGRCCFRCPGLVAGLPLADPIMTDLSAVADELDALVRDGRRIRMGDRNFEKPHADLDELVTRLVRAARAVRIFAGASAVPVVTGREQVLVSVARAVPGRHVGPPSTFGPRADRQRLRTVPGSRDGA